MKNITINGAPIDCGKSQKGGVMGPDAARCAHIAKSVSDLGHKNFEEGNLPNPSSTSTGDHAGHWRARIPKCAERISIVGQTARLIVDPIPDLMDPKVFDRPNTILRDRIRTKAMSKR